MTHAPGRDRMLPRFEIIEIIMSIKMITPRLSSSQASIENVSNIGWVVWSSSLRRQLQLLGCIPRTDDLIQAASRGLG